MCPLGEGESRKKMANPGWTGRAGLKRDIEVQGIFKRGRHSRGCESCTDPFKKLSQRGAVLEDGSGLHVA